MIITESTEKSGYITYLYNAITDALLRTGGKGELLFSSSRTALFVKLGSCEEQTRSLIVEKMAEVIGIAYKHAFLDKYLQVSLGKTERKFLLAALISADFDGDGAYIRRKLGKQSEYALDGFFNFRLSALKEKWEKIASYIPREFSTPDLKRFCDFLVGESKRKIYLKDGKVFGENFMPLRRSRLIGEEDAQTEIMLADAGFIYCLGNVDTPLEDFLQKYYAERAIFS